MVETAPTLDDYLQQLATLQEQFAWLEGLADEAASRERVRELETQMEQPDFWNDQKSAAKVGAEHTRTRRKLEGFAQLRSELEDVQTLAEMAKEAVNSGGSGADVEELLADLEQHLPPLTAKLAQLREDTLFTGEYDTGGAIVSIHSGEGGVDAQDFAQMLMRMYLRFWERRDYKVQFNAEAPGEEAGIKSASFTVEGENAYGVMRAEAGVHRLVRLSPFDSAHRRHTSFAQVEVYPFIDDDVQVDIDDKELRIDTYRASGAGGQHVNKTDSAVRITHLPTSTVVQCQNERSQHANRETAMRMLRAKLFELEQQKREALLAGERGEVQNVGFGSQIRSYVLHPYQMVKDLRTRHETGNVQAVLDGDLDGFVQAYLLQKAQLRERSSSEAGAAAPTQ